MLIPNSEQTSEKAELEGPGYHDDSTVVRKEIVCVKQAMAQFTTRAGESPGLSLARHLWKKAGTFSLSQRRSPG